MMKFLVGLSLTFTLLTAIVFHTQTRTCEERGGKYETLEPVGAGVATKVCVPALIEVSQASD
jgi:hypothetical protein